MKPPFFICLALTDQRLRLPGKPAYQFLLQSRLSQQALAVLALVSAKQTLAGVTDFRELRALRNFNLRKVFHLIPPAGQAHILLVRLARMVRCQAHR